MISIWDIFVTINPVTRAFTVLLLAKKTTRIIDTMTSTNEVTK